jgi:hypothetical protein
MLSATDIGRTESSLLPPGPPSEEEPKQRQADQRTDGCETTNDPATERVAIAASRVARGATCGVDDALPNAFAKVASSKR